MKRLLFWWCRVDGPNHVGLGLPLFPVDADSPCQLHLRAREISIELFGFWVFACVDLHYASPVVAIHPDTSPIRQQKKHLNVRKGDLYRSGRHVKSRSARYDVAVGGIPVGRAIGGGIAIARTESWKDLAKRISVNTMFQHLDMHLLTESQ